MNELASVANEDVVTRPKAKTRAKSDTESNNNAHSQLLADVRQIVCQDLLPIVSDIDAGHYPTDVLRSLASVGAASAHLDAPHGHADLGLAINAMAEVSKVCGSTAFLMWCQGVCGLYLQNAASTYLRETLLDDHASGFTLGGTALSNPMKSFANIETIRLVAQPDGSGWRVSGNLPWVSNLAPGQYCAAIAQVQEKNGQADPQHQVMFLIDTNAQGVKLNACPRFSGMEGTGTYAIELNNYHVGADELIADPVLPWLKRIRPAFVLLQAGMADGLIQASIQSIQAASRGLGHVNRYLPVQASELAEQYGIWREELSELIRTPHDSRDEFFLRVLKARATASELSLASAQAALLHVGAAGYVMSSPVQRRIRESHFVAIVTPALKHLRKEIARLEGR